MNFLCKLFIVGLITNYLPTYAMDSKKQDIYEKQIISPFLWEAGSDSLESSLLQMSDEGKCAHSDSDHYSNTTNIDDYSEESIRAQLRKSPPLSHEEFNYKIMYDEKFCNFIESCILKMCISKGSDSHSQYNEYLYYFYLPELEKHFPSYLNPYQFQDELQVMDFDEDPFIIETIDGKSIAIFNEIVDYPMYINFLLSLTNNAGKDKKSRRTAELPNKEISSVTDLHKRTMQEVKKTKTKTKKEKEKMKSKRKTKESIIKSSSIDNIKK